MKAYVSYVAATPCSRQCTFKKLHYARTSKNSTLVLNTKKWANLADPERVSRLQLTSLTIRKPNHWPHHICHVLFPNGCFAKWCILHFWHFQQTWYNCILDILYKNTPNFKSITTTQWDIDYWSIPMTLMISEILKAVFFFSKYIIYITIWNAWLQICHPVIQLTILSMVQHQNILMEKRRARYVSGGARFSKSHVLTTSYSKMPVLFLALLIFWRKLEGKNNFQGENTPLLNLAMTVNLIQLCQWSSSSYDLPYTIILISSVAFLGQVSSYMSLNDDNRWVSLLHSCYRQEDLFHHG